MQRDRAFHPKLPRVYWSEGHTLHAWDVAANEAKSEVALPGHIHRIQFSVDGSLLAVEAGRTLICDSADGTVKYELATPEKNRPPKIFVRHLLAIDDQERVWAIASAGAGRDQKNSLVRFLPDGQTWDTQLDGLDSGHGTLSSDLKLLVMATGGAGPQPWPYPGPGYIEVWNVASRSRVKRFPAHWNAVGQMCFSPDGTRLATAGSWTDVVKTWSLEGLAD